MLFNQGHVFGGSEFANGETATILAQFAVEPSEDRIEEIDTLITDLKAAGVWNKLDLFYNMWSETEQQATINWKLPGTYTLSKTSTVGHRADKGFSITNASAGHLSTGWSPSGNGVNWQTNSAMMLSKWTGVMAPTANAFGCNDALNAGSSHIAPNANANTSFTRGNVLGNITSSIQVTMASAASQPSQQWCLSRSASNAWAAYMNGTQTNTGSDASDGNPSSTMSLMRPNNNGTPANGAFGPGGSSAMEYWAAGSHLTNTEAGAFKTAMDAYKNRTLRTSFTSAAFQSTANQTGTSPRNFTSQGIGTADSNRWVLVCASTQGNATTLAITSIAGQTPATTDLTAAGSGRLVTFAWALVPTGTTGTITVTHDGNVSTSVTIAVYRIVVPSFSVTEYRQAAATETTTTLNVNHNAGDFMIGIGSLAGTFSAWTNLTADAANSGMRFASATAGSTGNTNLSAATTTSTLRAVQFAVIQPHN